MTHAQEPTTPLRRFRPLAQVRVWHLSALTVFVAIAIMEIRDQGAREPLLVGLAAAGFALYGVIGWVGWHFASRLEPRVGSIALRMLFMSLMAALFLVATLIYTAIQIVYLTGHL